MKWFFKLVRLVVTPLVLIGNWLTLPRPMQRPAEAQAQVDAQTSTLVLYQFAACPFCIKVRRAMRRLALNIEIRDALHDSEARAQLLQGGGEIKVPCLKITDAVGKTTWMYESSDIVDYLQARFGV